MRRSPKVHFRVLSYLCFLGGVVFWAASCCYRPSELVVDWTKLFWLISSISADLFWLMRTSFWQCLSEYINNGICACSCVGGGVRGGGECMMGLGGSTC